MLSSEKITKNYVIEDNRIKAIEITNRLTGKKITIDNPNEFVIGYKSKNIFGAKILYFGMSDCKIKSINGDNIDFSYSEGRLLWNISLVNKIENNNIVTNIKFNVSNPDVFIDSVEYLSVKIEDGKYVWSRPLPLFKAQTPKYWTTLGQPVYYDSFFMGVEFMCADNRVYDNKISLKYYIGRSYRDLGGNYTPYGYVIGSSKSDDMENTRSAFFEYVNTFARPYRFRIQYNSWYDNMLDITPENIESSFRSVHKGLSESGLRDIDCYVVDDGWVDYNKSEFWAFNDKFKNGFDKESALTNELNSTFGVWFGPRGGYTEAWSYAKHLKKIGYPSNFFAKEICTSNEKYVNGLADKMIEFIKKYNVTYFKIDGFAINACKNKNHGHPVGGYENLYFYSYQWELWMKAFSKIRTADENVFLNVTSHSHCSPWLLKYADSVWLNNSSDMYYEGKGDNLDQCLNYRDGRYYDFCKQRELQFPLAYIYNHEPCYAERNYNPPLPSKAHKTVVYTAQEFEKYLYMCMMRGTGFIELYYSPSMFDKEKWEINAKVLKWAEKNFDIINKGVYFGGLPKKGDVYGYIGYNNGECLLSIRNSDDKKKEYCLDVSRYSHRDDAFIISNEYGNFGNIIIDGNKINFILEPFEAKIIRIKYEAI